MKLLKTMFALPLLLVAAYATADNHISSPLGYGMSYILKVNDPAAIARAMTEVRTTDLGKGSPSGVVLNQLVAGGETGATHTIGVFYQSAMRPFAAMNSAAGELRPITHTARGRGIDPLKDLCSGSTQPHAPTELAAIMAPVKSSAMTPSSSILECASNTG